MVLRFVTWIGSKVTDAAEKELYDPEVIRSELMNLSEQLEAGEITEEEYSESEDKLLERLEEAQRRLEEA